MIENDFAESDTLEGRVEKLNGQTGLDFKLEEWPRHPRRGHLYSFSYAFAGQQHGTGPMDRHELLHWTATFALGFRSGHASADGAEGSTIPAAEKARRYRHKLADLLEKVEAALRRGAGKGELAALADEAHTVRTQLDVEERDAARRRGNDAGL